MFNPRTVAHFWSAQGIYGRKVLNLKSYVETWSISRFFCQRIWKGLFSVRKASKFVFIWLFAGLGVSIWLLAFHWSIGWKMMFSVLNERLSIWSYLVIFSLVPFFRLFSWYARSIGLSLMGFTAFVFLLLCLALFALLIFWANGYRLRKTFFSDGQF